MDSNLQFFRLAHQGPPLARFAGSCLSAFARRCSCGGGKIEGSIPSGYAATVLVVIFFCALNCFGLGVIVATSGAPFENTKGDRTTSLRYRSVSGLLNQPSALRIRKCSNRE